jgi:hypothetical protein
MNKGSMIILASLGLILFQASIFAGSKKESKTKVETYGKRIGSKFKEVKLCHLLAEPKKYKGQRVIVRGKVSSQCPSGCMLVIEDLKMKKKRITGHISKKIGKIPQRVGYFVRALALVKIKDKVPSLEVIGLEVWK